MKKIYYFILNKIYSAIRYIFNDRYDPNADHICCNCQKPILGFCLYCSEKCENQHVNN